MKFVSPHFPNLKVQGAGAFVDGLLELPDIDEPAHAKVRAVAAQWGIHEVPAPAEDEDELVDLSGLTVPQVIAQLLEPGDDAQRAKVIASELAADKPRKGILRWQPPTDPAPEPASEPEQDGETPSDESPADATPEGATDDEQPDS